MTGMDIFADYKTDGAAKAAFMVAVFILATATRGDWLLFFVYLSKNQLQNFFNVTNDQTSPAAEVTNISREITHTSLLERCRLQNLPLFLAMSIGSSFIMYYGISFGFMWYFYINRRNQAKEWKCQPDKFLTPENERHEILLGSLNMFLGSALSGVIACFFMNGGYTTLYYNVSDYGWLYLIASLVTLFVYIECSAYYIHRLFHIPLLYKTIHKIHHRYHQPTAFSAVAMHPVEFFLHQSYLAVIPFLVPVHPVIYISILLYTYYYGLMDHSGIKMDALWPWQPPTLFHDNHHKYFHVNFGFNSYFLDWLHGTLRRNDRMYGEDIFYGHGKAIPSGTDVKKSQVFVFLNTPTQGTDLIREYFFSGYTYSEIILMLFYRHGISISLRQLHRVLRSEGLQRRTVPNVNVVQALQRELEGSGSSLGYRTMARRLLSRHGLTVSRRLVAELQREYDPDGVNRRRCHNFTRRTYRNSGPNYLIHIDGYDKLKRYGFSIHGAICGFSRRVLWLNVAHTNNNPNVVASYFMKFVDEIKGVPRCIRMYAGTENVLIEDIQKAFRWDDTDDMAGERSVICGSSHSNQRIERWWLSNRQGGCQFWIDLFKDLEMAGLISTSNALQIECARFCFMELLQEELNYVRMEWNQHHVRFNNASEAPSGKPDLMYYLPNLYSTVDYKIPKRDQDICQVKVFCENNVDFPDYQYIIDVMNMGVLNKPKTFDEAMRLYGHLVGHFQ